MLVYAIDHLFGKWLFTLCKIEHSAWDPIWVESCNLFLKEYTGITGLSLSAFFVGGNLLAIGTSVMLYPIMKRVFTRYLNLTPYSTSLHMETPLKNMRFKINKYENNIAEEKSILAPRNTSFLRGGPH